MSNEISFSNASKSKSTNLLYHLKEASLASSNVTITKLSTTYVLARILMQNASAISSFCLKAQRPSEQAGSGIKGCHTAAENTILHFVTRKTLQAEAAKRKEGEKQARARAVAKRKRRWKLAAKLLKGREDPFS